MTPVYLFLALASASPVDDPVGVVDNGAKALERGGLYAVIVVLLLALVAIFVIKERQIARSDEEQRRRIEDKEKQVKELHALVLGMVEKQTVVLTEANLNARKIEAHLERFTAGMERLLRDRGA